MERKARGKATRAAGGKSHLLERKSVEKSREKLATHGGGPRPCALCLVHLSAKLISVTEIKFARSGAATGASGVKASEHFA